MCPHCAVLDHESARRLVHAWFVVRARLISACALGEPATVVPHGSLVQEAAIIRRLGLNLDRRPREPLAELRHGRLDGRRCTYRYERHDDLLNIG